MTWRQRSLTPWSSLLSRGSTSGEIRAVFADQISCSDILAHHKMHIPILLFASYASLQGVPRSPNPRAMALSTHTFAWDNVMDVAVKQRLLHTYFDKRVHGEDPGCEIFSIDRVPAACMLFYNVDVSGSCIVHEFRMNKGLLLMFDAGHDMRRTFYERHPRAVVEGAKGFAAFNSI